MGFLTLWNYFWFLTVFLSLKIDFILVNSADPDGNDTLCGILSESALFAKVPVYWYHYSVNWKNIFFISHPKHILWVLKRNVSKRRFF